MKNNIESVWPSNMTGHVEDPDSPYCLPVKIFIFSPLLILTLLVPHYKLFV